MDEETSGSHAAAAVDAAQHGDRLHFDERGLDSPTGNGVGHVQSSIDPLSRPQSPPAQLTGAGARGGSRTERFRHQHTTIPPEVGQRTI